METFVCFSCEQQAISLAEERKAIAELNAELAEIRSLCTDLAEALQGVLLPAEICARDYYEAGAVNCSMSVDKALDAARDALRRATGVA